MLAFSMDVEQLAGMVSVGTLLAFTMVAVSVLILRYVPPDEVPLPSSLQAAIDSVSLRYSNTVRSEDVDVDVEVSKSLGVDTWMRVLVWLVIGVVVYVIYGRNHSALQHAVYVPATHVDEIYKSSAESLSS
ncbi:hypothetical protein LXL04_020258 [Taraxacum kok-saghyz]